MKNAWVGSLPLAVALALQAQTATAWSCIFPIQFVEGSISEEEMRRQTSKAIFEHLLSSPKGDLVVFGQFTKNVEVPFLHEEQLEEIRGLFWPPAENVQMPYQIEYTYLDAFRFEGHQILNDELVPLVKEGIDVRISISAEYEGIADVFPPLGSDVIGVLRSVLEGRRLELTATPCPTYLPIEPSQVKDLLTCIDEGECS